MNYGFVYCLANECMPGIYKIGMTDRAPSQRCFELSSSTSAPKAFDLLCYGEVNDALGVERALHDEFAAFRVNKSREFFQMDYRAIYDSIHSYADAVAETTEGVMESARINLKMDFFSADSVDRKIEALLAALKFAGVRIWSDEDRIRTSKQLSLESWMTGAIAGIKKDLITVIPRKEPVTKLMSLMRAQAAPEKELDW